LLEFSIASMLGTRSSMTVIVWNKSVTDAQVMQRNPTFFVTCQGDVRRFHVNFPKKVHVRKTLDDFALAPLRYGVVETGYYEFE
jgi:hypothetical protein